MSRPAPTVEESAWLAIRQAGGSPRVAQIAAHNKAEGPEVPPEGRGHWIAVRDLLAGTILVNGRPVWGGKRR